MRQCRTHPEPTPSGPASGFGVPLSLLVCAPLLVGLPACGGSDDDPMAPGNGGDAGVAVAVTHSGSGVGSVGLTLTGPGGASHTETTANDGTAEFEGLAAGQWELHISPPSYFVIPSGESDTRTVSVPEGGNATVNVTLAPAGEVGVAEVEMLQEAFDPTQVSVAAGGTVRWENLFAVAHTVTPQDHSEWSAGSIGATVGITFEAVMNNPGQYSYLCTIHAGMTGTVTVTP